MFESIKNRKNNLFTIKNNIGSVLSSKVYHYKGRNLKGIPREFRVEVWEFLLQNPMRITKELFSAMLKRCLDQSECSALIIKDLERTFFYFFKHKSFSNIVLEAKNVLLLWEVGTLFYYTNNSTTARTSSTSRACRMQWCSCC